MSDIEKKLKRMRDGGYSSAAPTFSPEEERRRRIENLRNIISTTTTSSTKLICEKPRPVKAPPVAEMISGRTEQVGDLEIFIAGDSYDINHVQGQVRIGDAFDSDYSKLAHYMRDASLVGFNAQKALYIDTETTGLAGGSGTMAFMVGAGYWRDGKFTVDQYFLRRLEEEPAMLDHLAQLAENYQYIVSFNGKSFDIPLLNARYVMNRRLSPFIGKGHLDLIHPIRRIFRRRLADCTLGNLECRLLGLERHNDVPGFEIPGLYFRFLRGVWEDRMGLVFSHNLNDIVSMTALLPLLTDRLNDPLNCIEHAADLYEAGRLFVQRGDSGLGIDCLREAIRKRLKGEACFKACCDLSTVLKREGRLAEALDLWEWMLKPFGHLPFAYIELAKHHEHICKNAGIAVEYTHKALSLDNLDRQTKADLEHRLARLKNKVQKTGKT